MKKIHIILVIVFLPFSCSLFKPALNIKEIIAVKDRIDASNNPAQKFILSENLKEENVTLENLTVKDVTESSNIDYDFCVITDIPTDKGNVECYIYSRNTYVVSKLEKGKSKINVKGKYSRFFTMLDQYYTKLEITGADIQVITEKK